LKEPKLPSPVDAHLVGEAGVGSCPNADPAKSSETFARTMANNASRNDELCYTDFALSRRQWATALTLLTILPCTTKGATAMRAVASRSVRTGSTTSCCSIDRRDPYRFQAASSAHATLRNERIVSASLGRYIVARVGNRWNSNVRTDAITDSDRTRSSCLQFLVAVDSTLWRD
jgi:hypothetical protein